MSGPFNEKSLRAEIVKVWGEYGAHVDVYDELCRRARDYEPCHDRGPRIGNDGAMYCVLPKGHEGQHEGDPSWRQHGWSQL